MKINLFIANNVTESNINGLNIVAPVTTVIKVHTLKVIRLIVMGK